MLSALTLSAPLATLAQTFPNSVIAMENQKTGTANWLLTNPATNREIEGYASLTSVNRGGQINLLVNTTNSTYILELFRIGWYAGAGARKMLGPVTLSGCVQVIPPADPTTGLVECNWTNPYTLYIPATPGDPTDWASGAYLARLTGGQDGKQSYIIFAVRDDTRPTDLLVQMSFSTYQAYNNWGGASLYDFNSVPIPAKKVSFNRPFSVIPGVSAAYWTGSGEFFYFRSGSAAFECNLVRWLEREGYDASYCSSLDTHSTTNLLWSHKGFISMGHDEYWSYPMRWNIQAARDRGVNLAFLSSNTCFWQVRFEPSTADGTPNRNMVCYKSPADPVYGTAPTFTTVQFRSQPINDLESSLLGVSFDLAGPEGDLVVSDPNHWAFANTGLAAGQQLPGLLGYEVDSTNQFSPTNIQVACSSPYAWLVSADKSVTFHSHAASYTAPSGATVFAAGSMQWSWGLDDFNVPNTRLLVQNPASQHITRNILARLANAPAPSPTLFFCTDNSTAGEWKPHYGGDGCVLPNDSTNLPAYALLAVGGADTVTYLASSPNINSLRRAAPNGRYLAGWSSPTNFTMDLNLSDGKNHPVALYFWDWNNAGRTQLVEVFDAATTNLLDQRIIGSFTNGQWWVWQINGHVRIRFTNLAGPDCLANALAFGNGAAAVYMGEDSLTQGNWKSNYGADGEYIAGDSLHASAYGFFQIYQVSMTNWSASASDPRALQLSASTNRMLAAWNGSWVSGVYLKIRDNAWHQLAIYCEDGDLRGRKQRIALFDLRSHTMLDSREVTNFGGGKYLVWNIRGEIDVRVQNSGPVSSAFSGIFLDPPRQPPTVALTSPIDLQAFNLPTNIVLTANAAESDGWINQVSFYADGLLLGSSTNAPFSFTWTNALVGHHQITAMVMANNFARTVSDPVNIFVQPPVGYQPPVAQVTSPIDGSICQLPTNITLSAYVTFTSAPLSSAQFLVDGVPYGPPFTNTPFTVIATNLYGGVHSIRVMVTDAFGVAVTSPGSLVTIINPTAQAVFRKYDFSREGTWIGLYGSAGYLIINEATNLPPYAAVNPLGSESSVLAYLTTDPRALQNPATGGTVRFAGIWYSSTNFVLDVNLQDGNTRRIELYFLDWFNQGGSQTIQVMDVATSNVLDARTLSNYSNGTYLIWDITGHVQFSFSSNSSNTPALLTGIFIDPPRTQPEVALSKPADRAFFAVPTNILIQAYAFSGTNYLQFVQFFTNGTLLGYGDGGTPQSFTWINPPPGNYTLTARAMEWDGSNALSAPVSITVEAPSTTAKASFVLADTNHQGSWGGVFGWQGYLVAGDSTSLPAYVALNISAQFITWASNTADTRALQRAAGGSRVAAAWYAYTNVDLDVSFTDTNFHRMTLYFVDWNDLAGAETVDVLDRFSGAVLDHEVLPPFASGLYEVWDMKGHLEIRITRAGGSPAVVSGLFFDASGLLPAISITNPVAGTFFVAPANIAITANAAADSNNVTRVDFYDGSTLLGTVSNNPPYTFIWTNAPAGGHSLSAHEAGLNGAADSPRVPILIYNVNSNTLNFIGLKLLADGTAILDALVPTGRLLRLEAAASLNGNAVWTPLVTNTSSDNLFHFIDKEPTNYPQRFFRIIALP